MKRERKLKPHSEIWNYDDSTKIRLKWLFYFGGVGYWDFPIKSSHIHSTVIHQLFVTEINKVLVPSKIYPSNHFFFHFALLLHFAELVVLCFMSYVEGQSVVDR